MQQQQVIENAIEGLRQATDLPVEWLSNAPASFDGYVTIHGGTRLIKLATEVKRRAMAHQLSELKQLQKAEGETLLLAESISDDFKHALRESKQNYLDGAGNCFIHSSGMLLVVQGRKAPANQTAIKHPFGKSGTAGTVYVTHPTRCHQPGHPGTGRSNQRVGWYGAADPRLPEEIRVRG